MFIKCNCVGRLAGNEKSRPCIRIKVLQIQERQNAQDKPADIQFLLATRIHKILNVGALILYLIKHILSKTIYKKHI